MAESKDLIRLKSSPVTDSDRLRFAIFMAIAIHFVIIFGIQFVLPSSQKSKIPRSLEVTLAHRQSLEAPNKADFIGQANQQGAGDAKLAERPTTELEHFKTTDGTSRTPSLEAQPEEASIKADRKFVTSKNGTFQIPNASTDENKPLDETQESISEVTPEPELLKQLNLEQDLKDQLATRGEKKDGVSASIKASPDEAPYLEAWRNKVLQVGNKHYSPIAHKLGYGTPTIRVVINKNGSLASVSIQKSSGNVLLDETAKELVRLAAPFAPLPPSLLKKKNTLEIIRKMNFDPGSGVTSRGNQ